MTEPAGGIPIPAGTALPAVELTEIPFFPQSRYQCGPAALATVLGASGVHVTPQVLTDRVYVPGRRGSFQVELAAAARSYGRIPYQLAGGLDSLTAEVAAGRPVLVLQNLAFGWAPRWHYAVVVGFDPGRDRVVLRSGRTERRLEHLGAFHRSWSLGGQWGLVLLEPGDLPAGGDPARYLQAVVAAAGALSGSDHAAALDAGVRAWPEDADLAFASANLARRQDHPQAAVRRYRRTLALAPDHVGALNNLADLLSVQGCQAAALTLVDRGLSIVAAGSPLLKVLEATRAEILERQAAAPEGGRACQVVED